MDRVWEARRPSLLHAAYLRLRGNFTYVESRLGVALSQGLDKNVIPS